MPEHDDTLYWRRVAVRVNTNGAWYWFGLPVCFTIRFHEYAHLILDGWCGEAITLYGYGNVRVFKGPSREYLNGYRLNR